MKTRPQLRGGDAPVEEYAMRLLCAFIVCALIGLLGSTSVAEEGDGAKKVKPKKVQGEIVAVHEDSLVLSVQPKKKKKKKGADAEEGGDDEAPAAEEVTVTVEDGTRISLNGEEAALSDLAAGETAMVKHVDLVAKEISVGKKPKKKKKKKKKKNDDDGDDLDAE